MIFDNLDYMAFDEKDKTLLIRHPFTGDTYRIRSWDESCATEKISPDNSREVTSTLKWDLPLFEYGMSDDIPTARLFQTVPGDIRDYLTRYPFDQLYLLKICALSERACQLARSSPNLLWYIAEILVQCNINKRDAHEILGHKRRTLLKIQGTQDEEWIIRLLEKLGPPPPSLSRPRLLLKQLLSNSNIITALRHNKNISWEMLGTAYSCRELLNIKSIKNIFVTSASSVEINTAVRKYIRFFEETKRIGLELNIVHVNRIMANIRTTKQLEVLHDAWTQQLNRIANQKHKAIIFPPPPFEGDSSMAPIRDYYELLHEGSTMHNCVASYKNEILSGNSYIYKLLYPERATIEIVPMKTAGYWRMNQIFTYCNQHVEESTKQYASAWFSKKMFPQVESQP